MARIYDDPLGFVMYAYPWGSTPELSVVKLPEQYAMVYDSEFGPDLWACELLDTIGEEVRARGFNGRDPVPAIRLAVASGHGIGKSAFIAWVVGWLMSTRPHCNGVVTANTADQLSTKTWAEISKWNSRSITQHWFDISTGKGAMRMHHKQHPSSWKVSAQTCREENSESFAGLHAASSTPFYLFDEASNIPDEISNVAEGGLTDGEPLFIQFGNPTRNSGAFHKCFHGMKHRWITHQIDSRQAAVTNKSQIQEWIDDHGIDSDFVKVRVRGMFPLTGNNQFIATPDVDAAFGKKLAETSFNFAPVILTCDPAWTGGDDLIIAKRQGLAFWVLRTIAKNDNDFQIAATLAQLEDEHKADAVFIDAGYGTGIYSAGQTMGRDWRIVWFGGSSGDEGCENKRAEMYKLARDWLKAGGALPPDQDLYNELTNIETVFNKHGRIQLESKAEMKARGMPSPNKADALVLSFAFPVHQKKNGPRQTVHALSYDPFSDKQRANVLDYNPTERI
jgi:hypothetical protein